MCEERILVIHITGSKWLEGAHSRFILNSLRIQWCFSKQVVRDTPTKGALFYDRDENYCSLNL